MSRIQLPRTRKHSPLFGESRPTASRPDSRTEDMLREMAFVLEATRRVREAITGERAEADDLHTCAQG